MKEFDTYLFDFDGTLVDSQDSLFLVFSGAFSKVGVSVTKDDVLKLMRCSLRTGYDEMGAPNDDISYELYASEIVRLLDDPDVLKVTKTYSDTKEVLTSLKTKGKTLGIVTSNSRKHVLEVLHFIGLDKSFFSIIVGNGETKKHKPNPDPIYKGLELLGISSKERVCYVGDALDDVRTAVNAGVTPILVDRLDEYSGVTELEITDLNVMYLEAKKLSVELIGRGVTWLDTGTHESLVEASIFVKTIEDKMGLKISCPEEIAYANGWISKEKLVEIGQTMAKNQYGQHLLNVAEGKVKIL